MYSNNFGKRIEDLKQEYLPKEMKDKIYYNDKWGNDERNYKKQLFRK